MSLIETARQCQTAGETKYVAEEEKVDECYIKEGIAKGSIVIPYNKSHKSLKNLIGIGTGLRTKVNTNFGTSSGNSSIETELKKLKTAVEAGTDTVMDLSTDNIDEVRKEILNQSPVPVGTVPIYQAAVEAAKRKGIVSMSIDGIFDVIEKQAQEGVDFMTLHCGVTRKAIETLREEGRTLDIVSRGGAFLATWMMHHNRENPLFEYYDKLLGIAKKYNITLSLGDGLRPGCLADATDRAQIQELITLGELTQRAWKEGVQVIIEGPGHVPLDQIKENVLLEKQLCHGAPFYVLGPLVTDIAPGYDHIVGAIGGAIAAAAGADYLCYLTPSEHLSLPTIEDVKQGVFAVRIAAHAGDVVKGVGNALDKNIEMAKARKKLDWEKQITLAIDPEIARQYRERSGIKSDKCTMCGEYCAISLVNEYFRKDNTT